MTWRHRADLAIQRLALTGQPFTADDLLEEVGHPDSDHGANGRNNAVGAVFRDASRSHLIESVGVRPSRQAHRKSGMVRVWKGTTHRVIDPKIVPAHKSLAQLRTIRNQLADTISQLEQAKSESGGQRIKQKETPDGR